jgi:GntR family transcriptional regulator
MTETRTTWAAEQARGAIRRQLPTPLHVQFRYLLLELIERGEVRPGDKLPPERELASRFGVSLAPVRQAILDLVREGLLHRVPGKGTFLRDRPPVDDVSFLFSFSESMRAQGLQVEVRPLRHEVITAPPQVADALGGERRVLCFERIPFLEGEPAGLFTSFVSRSICPRLVVGERHGFSLYRALEDQFGVEPVRAQMVVAAEPCTTRQSELLGISTGTPLLHAEGTVFDREGRSYEYFEVVYRSDRIRLRLDTYRWAEDAVHGAAPGDLGAEVSGRAVAGPPGAARATGGTTIPPGRAGARTGGGRRGTR